MINNPTDSVCDYLAELLYEDVSTLADANQKIDSPVVKPLKDAPKSEPEHPAAKVVPNKAAPTRSEVLDAPSFDKEKLAKLLRSAPLEVAPDKVANKPVMAAPQSPVEQEIEDKDESLSVSGASSLSAPEPEPEPLTEVAWCENGRPSWAQERFDVLLFKVHGLTLAVPLIALGQIQPITDELTPIFGQAKWFMGLQPTPMGQIKTVNTALFVMPERYDDAFLASAKYVVSIDGLPWGLAVDSVQQPKTLDPDDVKWRQGRSLRPWLAGTIKEHMCALIDVPNMGIILAASDKNSKKI